MSRRRTLLAGIGSPHGDDQAGWRVVQCVAEQTSHDALEVLSARTPADLLDRLQGVERLLICDACQGLGEPGQLQCWRWPAAEIGRLRWSGLHDLSLSAVLGIAQRLQQLPDEVVVWGIESLDNRPLADLSPPVLRAIPALAQRIANQILDGIEL